MIIDTSRTKALYTLEAAADYLGISRSAVGRLVAEGFLPYQDLATARVVRIEDLERVKREYYVEQGMAPSEIAQRYGVMRQLVNYHLSARHVKPIGVDRKNRGARMYRREDVEVLAQELGWQAVDQSEPEAAPS